MNYSEKFTFPLFETILVFDGVIQNKPFHRNRFIASYKTFFNSLPPFDLFEGITIPEEFQKGQVKLRISYSLTTTKVIFASYQKKEVQTLKLVDGGKIDYSLKYENRSVINELTNKKGQCDDILIIKNGCVTDSSYANIVFATQNQWLTPKTPLLKGTMRSKLLETGVIQETEIKSDDIFIYEGFQLINAMIGFDPKIWCPINNIIP